MPRYPTTSEAVKPKPIARRYLRCISLNRRTACKFITYQKRRLVTLIWVPIRCLHALFALFEGRVSSPESSLSELSLSLSLLLSESSLSELSSSNASPWNVFFKVRAISSERIGSSLVLLSKRNGQICCKFWTFHEYIQSSLCVEPPFFDVPAEISSQDPSKRSALRSVVVDTVDEIWSRCRPLLLDFAYVVELIKDIIF